jgi:tetratricopeptide (TPR) repeat protein
MKTINIKIGISILFTFICLTSEAQTDKGHIRHGNREFKNGNYSEAEVNYRKSLDKEYSPKAQFNLGDALYEQKNYEEASKAFSGVTERNTSNEIEANAYYNLGNTLMAQEKYGEAFESYKKALKINPDDEDFRYNLEYARWKMIQQQQQQNQEQQQQNQDQEQDQNQDQQQEQEQNQEQQQQNQDQEQDQQQQQQQQQQQMSKEDAERMLKALENQEKETMEEMNEKKASMMQKRKSEKDW